MLQAGARVLTLDQLEGLKVRLAGCPASCLAAWLTVECAAAMTGQPVAGSLGLLPINHLVLWPCHSLCGVPSILLTAGSWSALLDK